jgi:O-antigen/teichoic acid export membrane protein
MLLKVNINNISGLQYFQLLRFGTLLIISIVFAKSGLTVEAIGDYEVFLFITALTCSFWINGIIQSFLPLFRNNNSFELKGGKSPELFNVFVLISLFSFMVVVLLVLFQFFFSGILTNTDSIPFFFLLLTYVFFSSPAYLVEYFYLLKNKAGWMLKYGILTFSAQLLLMAVPAFMGMSVQISIIGLVIISLVRYVWLIILLRKYAHITLSKNFIKEHLHLAWPLIISSLIGSSAQYVDGFLVLNKFGADTFAIFRYGAKEFPLVLLMANALSTAMTTEFSVKENQISALKMLRDKTTRLMHLLFPVTIVLIIFSSWLYPRIFSESFSSSAVIFNIYLLLIISRLLFPHSILIGLKKTKIIMYAAVADLSVNIILSITFIYFWGIEGVAFATFIAYAVQKIIWIIYIKRVLGILPNQYIPIFVWVIYSTLTIIAFYAVY